jgi:hypothetical protein
MAEGTLAADVPLDVVELTAWLAEYGVAVDDWGSGEAKSVLDLSRELEAGESWFTEGGGAIVRHVQVAEVRVETTRDGRRLRLVEQEQRFEDGRTRKRTGRTWRSLAEKLIRGEEPIDAARRGVEEELGITEPVEFEAKWTERLGPAPSGSYPDLPTLYTFHLFAVELPPHLFETTYVESGQSATTTFAWSEVGA